MAISANDVFAEAMTPEMIEASDLRAKELLEEYDTLQKLRKALDLTQEHVGQQMGTKQVSVAQLEKRSDYLLSTLRNYVEALGGELQLVVKFKGRAPVRLAGIGEKIFSEVQRRQNRSRGSAA
jgi:predicted transcriptional regulator